MKNLPANYQRAIKEIGNLKVRMTESSRPVKLENKASLEKPKGKNCIEVRARKNVPEYDRLYILEQIGKFFGVAITHKTNFSTIGEVYSGTIPVIVKPVKGDPVKYETLNIASLNRQLQAIMDATRTPFVKISDEMGNVYRCVRCEKTTGNPKSDFNFVTDSGERCLFISHKKDTTTGGFQQWGGVLKDSVIKSSQETRSFFENLKQAIHDFPDVKSFSREIMDKRLKLRAMYGHEYGKREFSPDNVWAIMKGNVRILKATGDTYKLDASKIYYNGYLPEKNDSDHPVFLTRTANDRESDGIFGVRVGIFPRGFRSEKNQMKI